MESKTVLSTPHGDFTKAECENLQRKVGNLVWATDIASGQQVKGVVMKVNLLEGTISVCAYQVGWKICSMAQTTAVDLGTIVKDEFAFYYPIINALLDNQLECLNIQRDALAALQLSMV